MLLSSLAGASAAPPAVGETAPLLLCLRLEGLICYIFFLLGFVFVIRMVFYYNVLTCSINGVDFLIFYFSGKNYLIIITKKGCNKNI